MDTKKLTSPDSFQIHVPGRIDGKMASQMEKDIEAAIRDGASTVLVNLSDAVYICSAGIRVLLQYYRQMKDSHKLLCVVDPSPSVEAILDLTGFKELIVRRPENT